MDGKETITTVITPEVAASEWESQIAAAPSHETRREHLVVGVILPIWDRLKGDPKVYRLQTDDGERMIGRVIPKKAVAETLKNLGIGSSVAKMTPAQQFDAILKGGQKAVLANAWEIKRVTVSNDTRIEIIKAGGYFGGDKSVLIDQGAFFERIGFEERAFIPTGKGGLAAFERITKSKPIVEMFDPNKPAEKAGGGEDGGVAFSRGSEDGPIATAAGMQPSNSQEDAGILNESLVEDMGDEYRNAFVQVQVPDADAGVVGALEKAFGRRVVAVAATSGRFAGLFAGARSGKNPDALYVTYPRRRDLIAVAGHELYHDLAARHPDLHAWFLEQAIPYMRDTERYAEIENRGRAGDEKLGPVQLAEELLADFTGDALADPEFLQQLADDNPGKFTQLLTAVRQWLNKVIARLQGNRSDEFITDVKALRDHLAVALKVYSEGGGVAEEVPSLKFMTARNGSFMRSESRPALSITENDARKVVAVFNDSLGDRATIELIAPGDEVPESVKQAAQNAGVGLDGFRGVIVGRTMYVVQDAHSNATEMERTIFHELYGHYGTRALFGKDVYARLASLHGMIGGDRVLELAEKYGVNFNDYRGMILRQAHSAREAITERAGGEINLRRGLLMDELLAHIAEKETGKIGQYAKELIGAVRQWLRKHGFARLAEYGDTDLAYLLKEARESIKTGKLAGGGIASFMTAWHGSPHDHDGFSAEHIGMGEGAQAFGWGHYFAGRKEIAEYYRDTLARGVTFERNGKTFNPGWGPTSDANEIALSHAAGRLRDALKYPPASE